MLIQVECGSFGLLILTFFLSFLFLYFWSEAQNDYNDFDWWVTHSSSCGEHVGMFVVICRSSVGMKRPVCGSCCWQCFFCLSRFNFGTLGFWFPWSLVLLVVAASLFTYIALLLVCKLMWFLACKAWKHLQSWQSKRSKKQITSLVYSEVWLYTPLFSQSL